MHARSAAILLVLFSVEALALAFASLPASAQETVKLGFVATRSGAYEAEGLDEWRGAELAAVEINQGGGILNRRIELILQDSHLDGDKAEGIKTGLIDRGAKMIFGGISSDVAIIAGDVAHKNNVVFFSTTGASIDITGKNGYKTTFRGCPDAWMTARVLGGYLIETYPSDRNKYFYIVADYNWGWTTEAAIRSRSDTMDVDIHGRVKVPFGEKDPNVEKERIKAALVMAQRATPNVLVLTLFGKQFVTAIRIAHELGLNRSSGVHIVVPSMALTMAEEAGPSLMEGVIGATFWDRKIPERTGSAEGRAFVRNFKDRYGRFPATAAASAYSILKQYKAAVETAKDFDTNKVIAALESTPSSYSLKDEQRWRKFDHQSIQSVFLVEGRPSEKVRADNDYFEIKLPLVHGAEVAMPQVEWILQRLMNGKSPKLD